MSWQVQNLSDETSEHEDRENQAAWWMNGEEEEWLWLEPDQVETRRRMA